MHNIELYLFKHFNVKPNLNIYELRWLKFCLCNQLVHQTTNDTIVTPCTHTSYSNTETN